MKRRIYLEGIFKSTWLSKFISCLFHCGQKWKAERLVYFSFFFFKKHLEANGLFLLFECLEYLKPQIGLKLTRTIKSRKKIIQAQPTILKINAQYRKAIYWFIKAIQLGKETYFHNKLQAEIKNIIFNRVTYSIKKKKEYYSRAALFKSTQRFKWN